MRNYAYIVDGVVQYIQPADGDITTMFHEDMTFVDVTDITPIPVERWAAVEVDGVWEFAAPLPPVLTDEELAVTALVQRDALLAAANEATAGMADAYVADLLSPEEVVTFKAYAAYKLALNKITKQTGYPRKITWPKPPTLEAGQ
jgi:hypothetical protein